MGYDPKYCCECGDKIENVNSGFLASRRFCQLCETNYKLEDWMPRVILSLGILFGVIGIGAYFQAAEQPFDSAAKQLATNKLSAKNELPGNEISPVMPSGADRMQAAAEEDVQSIAEVEKLKTPVVEKVKKQQNRLEQKNAETPVYFCGAETKKGTACSRKMKGGGRCWQHEGREAMLPQQDLLVSR